MICFTVVLITIGFILYGLTVMVYRKQKARSFRVGFLLFVQSFIYEAYIFIYNRNSPG